MCINISGLFNTSVLRAIFDNRFLQSNKNKSRYVLATYTWKRRGYDAWKQEAA